MLHTIKPQKEDFNLLYLSDGEYLINTIKCYCLNTNTRNMDEGKLHLNTRSSIIQPKDISLPLIKLKYSESLVFKVYSIEEIVNFYVMNVNSGNQNEGNTGKEKQSYLQRSSTYRKKNLNSGGNVNFINFGANNMNSVNNANNNLNNSNNYLTSRKSYNVVSNFTKQQSISTNKDIINPNSHSTNNINNANVINNNNILTNSASNFFSVKLKNFGEMVNKVIKEGTNSNNLNTLNSGGRNTININNNNNFNNMNFDLQNKKKINFLANTFNQVSDLVNFFQDNNLNFPNFCSFFQYLQNNFLKDEKFNIKYYCVLIKITKTHLINRTPVTMYDVNIHPQSYFLIIEDEDKKCKSFLEDKKFITETLIKLSDETKEFNNLIYKKISEIDLNHVNETIFKCKASRILPEGTQYGLFLLTLDKHIEFIPVCNNYKNKSLKVKFSKIQALVPYRYLYKNKALNIFFYKSRRSKIFDFENESDYKYIYNLLSENAQNLEKDFTDVKYHTNLWFNGLMSNYDYILYLNFIGSRSFSDLSQYPVFPWLIINYEDDEDFDISEVKNYRDLSKPIGALNPEKLEHFGKKYIDMKLNNSISDIPYLYGTHYSNPAYVIYYLTRAFPHFQLQIQNGSFGPSDRLFNSIKDCWYYTYALGNDVKELIPEFYNSNGEFLMNIHNINLGKTKNNKNIDNVKLPNWAKCAHDLININKMALESEYVSNNINNWIDLIFGYKQRSEEAEAADNLFCHKTYDNYNYDSLPEGRKNADIVQILQFGQTPRQLFAEPHPKKRSLDMLNYQLSANPKEMILTIEKYKKENEKLENNYKKMEHSKFLEKEKLIREYKEVERERSEKIKQMKETFLEKENEYKETIQKMIDQNADLKEKFNIYDTSKDKFFNDMISNLQDNHQKDIER